MYEVRNECLYLISSFIRQGNEYLTNSCKEVLGILSHTETMLDGKVFLWILNHCWIVSEVNNSHVEITYVCGFSIVQK